MNTYIKRIVIMVLTLGNALCGTNNVTNSQLRDSEGFEDVSKATVRVGEYTSSVRFLAVQLAGEERVRALAVFDCERFTMAYNGSAAGVVDVSFAASPNKMASAFFKQPIAKCETVSVARLKEMGVTSGGGCVLEGGCLPMSLAEYFRQYHQDKSITWRGLMFVSFPGNTRTNGHAMAVFEHRDGSVSVYDPSQQKIVPVRTRQAGDAKRIASEFRDDIQSAGYLMFADVK